MICGCRLIKILSLIAPLVVMLSPTDASAFVCADATTPGGGGSTSGTSSIACGISNSSNPEDFSTALGYANSAEKEYSTAVGGLNTTSGAGSTALGYNNRALGQDSVAIGSGNTASGVSAFAAGRASTASGENAIVIGNNSQATVKNSVALGAQSLTANQHTGIFNIINGGVVGVAGVTSAGGTVSVGQLNKERQIQNVASGVVNAASTDAVNGSQLFVVGAQVNTNSSNIADNTASIKTLDATVTAQGAQIAANTANIAANATDIKNLNTTVTAQGGQIAANTANIAANATDIKNLNTIVTAHGGQIATNTANIAANTADIKNLNTTVTTQGGQIAANTSNIATNTANIALNSADIGTLGVTTAAALGGGAKYATGTGVSAPTYTVQSKNYNNVGSAIHALDDGLTNMQSQISGIQTQNNLLAAGYLGHEQDIAALRNSVQRGYEGSAIAAAAAGGNYLPDNKKFAIVGKLSQFRGQYGFGMQGQMRLSENIVGIAGFGGGLRYGGVMTTGGIAVAW